LPGWCGAQNPQRAGDQAVHKVRYYRKRRDPEFKRHTARRREAISHYHEIARYRDGEWAERGEITLEEAAKIVGVWHTLAPVEEPSTASIAELPVVEISRPGRERRMSSFISRVYGPKSARGASLTTGLRVKTE
jgi:hypothetical protein